MITAATTANRTAFDPFPALIFVILPRPHLIPKIPHAISHGERRKISHKISWGGACPARSSLFSILRRFPVPFSSRPRLFPSLLPSLPRFSFPPQLRHQLLH